MTEIAVQFASRYIKRKQSDAVGKNLLKTLTEPITNSDDSYRQISESNSLGDSTVFPITIYVDKKTRLVRIIDQAQGMTTKELEAKFREYGAAKSGAYKGFSTRGLFGQGISDVLFYHKDGKIMSIKDGEASICSFYWKNDKQYISVEKVDQPLEKIAKKWGIDNPTGTTVEFTLDNTTLHDYEKLVKKLSVFYMLRLINNNDKRSIKLVYKDRGGTKKSLINYQFPKGELVDEKKFNMSFEKYDPIKIDVQLYRSDRSLETVGDERENGLLVSDDKEAVYAQTFFGLDNLPGADKYFGFMKLTGAREIILDKINDSNHPEAILSDSRDGFNTQHEFYRNLTVEIKDWLYPILNKERQKTSDEGVSESTKENHKKAFDELNKLYAQLTGEDTSGLIKPKGKNRPAGGIEFARNEITLTAGKRYGMQLLIDTKVIKPGSVIKLKSAHKNIGFTPTEIIVSEEDENDDEILIKTVIITGTKAGSVDTLEASVADRNASVVISIVSEEIIYPEKGIVFNPEFSRIVVNHDSNLYLYVDLNTIKPGKKITLSSSNKSVVLKKSVFIVPERMRKAKDVAKIEIPLVGLKSDESAIIEARHEEYSAQARVDVKERIKPSPVGPSGKFRGWDFDDGVPKNMQTTFDSIEDSATQGYILINSSHPINKYYFGDNPQKTDVENSHESQLYLAELILNESLGAMIPEAYQKGVIARNYGPEYDIPVYIAQKKFELGPIIYNFFVEEQSPLDVKREKQLEEIKMNNSSTDEDILDGLGDRESQMIEMRFGLNEQRPHTLDEIGTKFKITRERVRQIIQKALAKKYAPKIKATDKLVEGATFEHELERDFIQEEEEKIRSLQDKIVYIVAQSSGLTVEEIKKSTRKAKIAIPRQIAMYLIRDIIGLSFPYIGEIFGGFDHTTVMYACEKIKDNQLSDQNLANKIAQLREKISDGGEIQSRANKTEDFKHTSLDEVLLSNRAKNALVNNGVETVEELTELTKKQVLNMKGLGVKTVNEILDALNMSKLN